MIDNQEFREKVLHFLKKLEPRLKKDLKIIEQARAAIEKFAEDNVDLTNKVIGFLFFSDSYEDFKKEVKEKLGGSKSSQEKLFKNLDKIPGIKNIFPKFLLIANFSKSEFDSFSVNKLPSIKSLKNLVRYDQLLKDVFLQSLKENKLSAEFLVAFYKESQPDKFRAISGNLDIFPYESKFGPDIIEPGSKFEATLIESHYNNVSVSIMRNLFSQSRFSYNDFIELFKTLELVPILETHENSLSKHNATPDFKNVREVLDVLVHHLGKSDECGVQLGDAFDWLCIIARGCDFGRNMQNLNRLKGRLLNILNAMTELVKSKKLTAKKAQIIANNVTTMHTVRQLHAIEVELLRSARKEKTSPIVHQILERLW